jgi:hypothetical protein
MLPVWILPVLLVSGGAQPPLDTNVKSYNADATGAVSGRVYEEHRQTTHPEHPDSAVLVWILPRSEALVRRLEEIKRHARDSLGSYRNAAVRIRREREGYERALWEAGGADLVLSAQADREGRFSFERVPEGAWLVLTWRSVVFDGKSRQISKRQRGTFALDPQVDRYQAVTVWLTEVTVNGRTPTTVELRESNAWFTGVLEELKPGTSR